MRRIAPESSGPRDEGFTLLEVLLGMVILSLLGIGMWTAVTISQRSVERFHTGSLANARLLQIDDRFRECIARIRAPWWDVVPGLETSVDGWRIAFLDGDPRKLLVISYRDGSLCIDDGAYVSRYPGFDPVRLETVLGADAVPFGASLTLEGRQVGSTTIIARFGGASVRVPSSP
jgi:prepilin-type N-terminal cleavage/methylation domain-containing protein